MRNSPYVSDLEKEGTSWDPAEVRHHYLNHGVRFGIEVGYPVSRLAVELMSKASEAQENLLT